ncbi:MAG: glycosyltransferase [Cyanobacteria bacterium]|nr:glycosyltransferase [Cyanobacteriota bacterium]MDA0865214.1 glycosyltransferase [Cyanobacteriota bacterium]
MSSTPGTAAPHPLDYCPWVSVIIPIYNGVEDLPALADCLLGQTYRRDRVEYLLVDNNSQDDTANRLHRFAQEAARQGMTVRPLSEPNIQSSYAARNQGVRAAQGEILAFTDADCRPQPDWLTQLVTPFADAAIGLVVGEIHALPGRTLLEAYAEYREIMAQKHTIAHLYPYGQTANLAVRMPAFQEAGLFRPYLTTGGDADLCWRVQLRGGWQLHYAEDAIIEHRHRASFAELASQWRRYGRSNRYLHDLHGVPLGPDLGPRETRYRLARWILKDCPKALWLSLRGQAPWVSLVGVPLDLFCARSRAIGQRDAQLPEAARQIEWLDTSALGAFQQGLKATE